jgi:hypothetical protein
MSTKAPEPRRRNQSPIATAFFAALIGMISCQKVYGMGGADHQSPLHETLVLLGPFIFGGVVTAIAYRVLDYLARRPGPALPPPRVASPASAPEDRKLPLSIIEVEKSNTGARAVFLAIMGGSAFVGALLSGMFLAYGGDGGTPDSLGQVVEGGFSGAVQGVVIGGGFGLLIAVPAALLVWIAGKRNQ